MVTSKMPFFSWMHDYNTKGVFRNLLMEISGPPNPGLINYCDLGKKKAISSCGRVHVYNPFQYMLKVMRKFQSIVGWIFLKYKIYA